MLRLVTCSYIALLTLACNSSAMAATALRAMTAADITGVQDVADPQISPDGDWVAYTVRTSNLDQDKRVTHVWMTSWDGKRSVQLTSSQDSEHSPRWSPDGQYLAFLSARGGEDEPEQLWLMNRSGGEAQVVTSFKGDVLDYEWSPDSRQIALIVMDEDPARPTEANKDKTPPPIVIDRYYFKEDETGYLGALRRHLYLFDVASRKADVLTPGMFDESLPAWSPDGSLIAFVSKRGPDPDRSNDNGLYVIAPRVGSEPRRVTVFHGDAGDSGWMTTPSWRPDGRALVLAVNRDPKLIYYAQQDLMIAPLDGPAHVITGDIDRNLISPRWSADGKSIYAFLEDDRNQHLVRVNAASGKMQRLLEGRRETTDFDAGSKNRIAILDSTVDRPAEVFALEGGKPRQLTRHNDAWLAALKLAPVEEVSVKSKDGTQISGFLVTPPDYAPGKRYPTILQIHGGPVSQYANAFMPMWQIFASQGYVVVAANPRGSSGRGEDFARAIWAEWGAKDTEDVLAVVDYAVSRGIADPGRLGVGGWSYGGILTDYVISKDTRFKAATSGASIGNTLAGYGTDMYVREYEAELGTPWTNLDVYLKNSYPLLHADRIRTPTLFLCGAQDFNVPLLNSEQMYQALRSTGVDTQLIIYPDQYHGLRKPSYLRDRMERYLSWFGKYLGDKGRT
jgi:dipeptidyl aminopeptidase/acylaminoacyl peptidase